MIFANHIEESSEFRTPLARQSFRQSFLFRVSFRAVHNAQLHHVRDLLGRPAGVALRHGYVAVGGCVAHVLQARACVRRLGDRACSGVHAAHVLRQAGEVSDPTPALPERLRDHAAARFLRDFTEVAPLDIVHLIYRQSPFDHESLDYEFSRETMLERWEAGRRDMQDTLTHPDWLKRAGRDEGVTQYDLARHSRVVSEGSK